MVAAGGGKGKGANSGEILAFLTQMVDNTGEKNGRS
jgi:hypothetical protein